MAAKPPRATGCPLSLHPIAAGIFVIVLNAYHINQQYLQEERQSIADALAEAQAENSAHRKENQELRELAEQLQRALVQVQAELSVYQNESQALKEWLAILEQKNSDLAQLIQQRETHDRIQQEKVTKILIAGRRSIGKLNTQLLLQLCQANIIPHYNPKTNHLTSGGELFSLRKVAKHLGRDFHKLKELYRTLKSVCQTRDKRFSYTYHQDDAKNCTDNFLSLLKSKGWITENSPLSQAKVVQGQLRDDPELTNFLNGGWLELYMCDWFAGQYRVGDGWLRNLQYTLVDGQQEQQGEFDLICLVQNRIVILECKTGNYTEKMPKYQSICRLLNLTAKQFIMLAVETPDEELPALCQKYHMTFANLNCLKQAFERAIDSPQSLSA